MIEFQVYRMRIGLNYCRHARVKGIDHLNYFEIYIIMATLLIGDFHVEGMPSNFHNLNVFGFRSLCIIGKNCSAHFIDHPFQTI